MTLDFHRGVYLPARIDEDTTLTADKLWIVSDIVRIGEGVTVNVDPGTTIQFYSKNQGKYQYATPMIKMTANSKLLCNGTEDNMINFTLAEGYEYFIQKIEATGSSNVNLAYTNTWDLCNNDYTSEGFLNFNFTYCNLNFSTSFSLGSLIQGKIDRVYGRNIYFDTIRLSTINRFMDKNSGASLSLYGKNVTNSSVNVTNGGCIYSDSFQNNDFFFDTMTRVNSSIHLKNNYSNHSISYLFANNCFINNSNSNVLSEFPAVTGFTKVENNTFYGYPQPFIDRTFDNGETKNVITGTTSNIENVWPFVSGYQFTNDKGEETTKFSNENMNLKLMFNRSMDTTQNLSVKFGSVKPYADYVIDGSWSDDYTWTGKCQIPTAIENGTQRLNISGGRAASDHFLTNQDNGYRITFDIDTTSAMAMNMFANPTKDGIQLQMKQDDYETVMGYNIYRSESKDGWYAKINTQLVIPENSMQDAEYLDTTVQPGKTYYYSYTAVMTDFSESHASGRTSCTALDTIDPIVSHTPVNQGYLGSNLNINCVIRDNVGVDYARLCYRVKGNASYKSVDMISSNDKYSGIIQANELSATGMEYYIEVSDGTNVICVGSKDSPYEVIIKESSEVSYLGDVDGNGIIEAVDAMLILQHINGKRVLVNGEFDRADLNGNAKLESMEALAILQYVNGNRTNLKLEA